MVTEFHRTESVTAVLPRFREVYPDVRCPSRFAVNKNVAKYQATGYSLNQNVGRSGRTRSARSAANVAAVCNVLETHEDGTISSRRNGLGLPHSTFNRITRLDLDFHPYQMKAAWTPARGSSTPISVLPVAPRQTCPLPRWPVNRRWVWLHDKRDGQHSQPKGLSCAWTSTWWIWLSAKWQQIQDHCLGWPHGQRRYHRTHHFR